MRCGMQGAPSRCRLTAPPICRCSSAASRYLSQAALTLSSSCLATAYAVCVDVCCQYPGVRPLHSVREIGSTPAAVFTALRARLAPVPVARPQDEILFYRDMSGESLHHRGYRSAMHRASLNEAAAAGILLLAGWPSAAEANPGGR